MNEGNINWSIANKKCCYHLEFLPFTKENDICDFLLASLGKNPFEKELLVKERICYKS